MKKLMALTLAATAAVAFTAPAQARDGCGPRFHRGPHGRCLPNYGGGYGAPGVRLVIGNYYHGRGWYDGHRYWHNRYRDGGGWRYR